MGLQKAGLAFALDVELQVQIPGVDRETVQKLVEQAHEVCPYSVGTRGNVDVRLIVLD